MASADLSRRVGKVVGYPPLSELSDLQRREFHEALLDQWRFEKTAARSRSHVRLSIRKYRARAAAAHPVPGAGTFNPNGSSAEAAGVSPERVRRRTNPDSRGAARLCA